MCLDILSASMTVHHNNVVVVSVDQNFRQVWTAMWILEIWKSNLGSLKEQPVLLKSWAIFPGPQILFLK